MATTESAEKKKGERPDYRVVQTDKDKEGKVIYKSVGGLWKHTSKNGLEYYQMSIGGLRLLVFKNDKTSPVKDETPDEF